MNKLTRWINDKAFELRTGIKTEVANDGKPVEEVVIRYKDFYFTILLDAESGEPTGNFGWSEGNPMTHVPIREFYTAVRKETNRRTNE